MLGIKKGTNSVPLINSYDKYYRMKVTEKLTGTT